VFPLEPLYKRGSFDIYCMDKKSVKTFEEFVGDEELNKIRKEGDKRRKKKGDDIFLDPDTQNPTSQSDDDPMLSGYPFGGI
jgi:hypothetical protein